MQSLQRGGARTGGGGGGLGGVVPAVRPTNSLVVVQCFLLDILFNKVTQCHLGWHGSQLCVRTNLFWCSCLVIG